MPQQLLSSKPLSVCKHDKQFNRNTTIYHHNNHFTATPGMNLVYETSTSALHFLFFQNTLESGGYLTAWSLLIPHNHLKQDPLSHPSVAANPCGQRMPDLGSRLALSSDHILYFPGKQIQSLSGKSTYCTNHLGLVNRRSVSRGCCFAYFSRNRALWLDWFLRSKMRCKGRSFYAESKASPVKVSPSRVLTMSSSFPGKAMSSKVYSTSAPGGILLASKTVPRCGQRIRRCIHPNFSEELRTAFSFVVLLIVCGSSLKKRDHGPRN